MLNISESDQSALQYIKFDLSKIIEEPHVLEH